MGTPHDLLVYTHIRHVVNADSRFVFYRCEIYYYFVCHEMSVSQVSDYKRQFQKCNDFMNSNIESQPPRGHGDD